MGKHLIYLLRYDCAKKGTDRGGLVKSLDTQEKREKKGCLFSAQVRARLARYQSGMAAEQCKDILDERGDKNNRDLGLVFYCVCISFVCDAKIHYATKETNESQKENKRAVAKNSWN